VQNAAHGRAIAVGLGGPDPLEDLVDGVGCGLTLGDRKSSFPPHRRCAIIIIIVGSGMGMTQCARSRVKRRLRWQNKI